MEVPEQTSLQVKSKIFATETHICDDFQKSLKKRKLSGPPVFSASKILNSLKGSTHKHY